MDNITSTLKKASRDGVAKTISKSNYQRESATAGSDQETAKNTTDTSGITRNGSKTMKRHIKWFRVEIYNKNTHTVHKRTVRIDLDKTRLSLLEAMKRALPRRLRNCDILGYEETGRSYLNW